MLSSGMASLLALNVHLDLVLASTLNMSGYILATRELQGTHLYLYIARDD